MARGMPEIHGVEHRFVHANGIRIHVAEAGPADAETLVLLHGWPQHWYVWRHQIPPLARDRHVLCPDLRGLGWTDAPPDGYEKERLADDLFALLDELEIERAGLIGHDWGGYVSFLAALREPDRFDGVLALGIVPPFAEPSLRGAVNLWRFWYQLVLAAPFIGERASGSVGRWLGSGPWDDETRESFVAQFREPERARAAVQYYRTLHLRELPASVAGRYRDAHLTVPSRLVLGARDPALRPAMVKGADRHADDLQIEVLRGVGHFVPEERPELVLERARELFGL
jgi:pimeloyl-ACP methyl ester carboxylesterase